MQAVILAAGRGTRMKELASELPKPVFRVQGKPILEHIVTGIVARGIRGIFIVTGWRAEVIEQHLVMAQSGLRTPPLAGNRFRTARAGRRNWRRHSLRIRHFC